YALTHNVERLSDDHENAKVIARALSNCSWVRLDLADVVTNLIYFRTPGRDAEAVVKSLAENGILSWTTGADQVRFVTHLDISKEDTREIVRVLEKVRI
ncbi:MAG TPA: low specificity L-threonine aldolase, partial [Spirochaetia bacterium]|nr:low specificity L-threonine aldolase [Spirochaetia bacterium]